MLHDNIIAITNVYLGDDCSKMSLKSHRFTWKNKLLTSGHNRG